MKHIGTCTLETERLILRRFRMEDAQAMFDNWASDPVVTRYLTWPAHSSVAVSQMVMRDWVEGYERADCYKWAITRKGDDRPVGDISVVRKNEEIGSVDIGYCLGNSCWGMGIMTEALRAVIGFLIAQVGANRVVAEHDRNNPASGRVMAKAGMTYEGTLRQAARNNQGLCDICVYSILKEEYR